MKKKYGDKDQFEVETFSNTIEIRCGELKYLVGFDAEIDYCHETHDFSCQISINEDFTLVNQTQVHKELPSDILYHLKIDMHAVLDDLKDEIMDEFMKAKQEALDYKNTVSAQFEFANRGLLGNKFI